MHGGTYYYNQAHRALNDIGIATDHGSSGPDMAIVSLDRLYRPASSLSWQRERGWTLSIEFGVGYRYRYIPVGPPDMTPGKAARACARLLTEQTRRQRQAIETAVQDTLSAETLGYQLGWQAIADLRAPILKAFRADVLTEQDRDQADSQ